MKVGQLLGALADIAGRGEDQATLGAMTILLDPPAQSGGARCYDNRMTLHKILLAIKQRAKREIVHFAIRDKAYALACRKMRQQRLNQDAMEFFRDTLKVALGLLVRLLAQLSYQVEDCRLCSRQRNPSGLAVVLPNDQRHRRAGLVAEIIFDQHGNFLVQ